MNKYQQYIFDIFNKSKIFSDNSKFIFDSCAPEGELNRNGIYGYYDINQNAFTIKQDEDIQKNKYDLIVSRAEYPFISSIDVFRNGKYYAVTHTDSEFIIKVDFNERAEKIRLKFTNNIAEDFEFLLNYNEADAEAYYKKLAELKTRRLFNAADIHHATGESLLNIYFQPCAENYDHSEIAIYIKNKANKDMKWQKILNKIIENGVFFASIGGLAYGVYAYTVKQYDKDNKVILETDYNVFEIKMPHFGLPGC